MDDQRPLRACMNCGQPTRMTRCVPCGAEQAKRWRAARGPMPSSVARGYDQSWRKLSIRARRAQPWCSDCGTTDDLTVDHTPEAWEAKAAGRPITPDLVSVCCRACNSKRGAARSGVVARVGTHPGRDDSGAPYQQGLPDTHLNTARPRVRRRPAS
jgi:5-methylcytosine-specific restriction enzyme A